MTATIPIPDLASVSPAKQAALGWPAKQPLNVTRLGTLLDDRLWPAHYRFKQAMVHDTTLDPWLREILILRVAHLTGCDYELHHHLSISAHLGFTAEQQQALADQGYAGFTPQERAVAEFTDQVVTHFKPTQATLAELRSFMSDGLVLELLVIISSYVGTATMALTAGIPNDAVAVTGWGESAPMPPEEQADV